MFNLPDGSLRLIVQPIRLITSPNEVIVPGLGQAVSLHHQLIRVKFVIAHPHAQEAKPQERLNDCVAMLLVNFETESP